MQNTLLPNRNFFLDAIALYAAQGVKILYPLLIFPHIARATGEQGWGIVATGLSYGMILDLIIQYGFSVSGPREVATRRNDRRLLATYVSQVHAVKLILAVLCALVTVVAGRVLPQFEKHPFLPWSALAYAIVNGFSLQWYFQGVRRLPVFAVVDVGGRGVSLMVVYHFIHGPEDIPYVLIAMASGTFVATLVAMGVTHRNVELTPPANMGAVCFSMKNNFACFLSRIFVSMYTAANAFLLSFMAQPETVGIYAIAEKITFASLAGYGTLNQILYPRLSEAARTSLGDFRRRWRVARVPVIGSGLVTALGLYVLSPYFVPLLFGSTYSEAVRLVRILALYPFLAAVASCYSVLGLLVFAMDRQFTRVLLYGGLANLACIPLLVPVWQGAGMAVSVLVAGAVVLVSSYCIASRSRLPV